MNDPHGRRCFLKRLGVGGVAAGTAGLAGCTGGGGPGSVTLSEGFESGLADWEARGHVGHDAGGDFDWAVEVTDERAAAGDRSLAVFTEGDHDDGTAWVVTAVDVDEGTAYDVRGSVKAWSASESFNTLRNLVAVVAPTAPSAEEDFPEPGANSTGRSGLSAGGLREPLDRKAGWDDYEFEWTTDALETAELFYAVGVSVVWESDRTDYLDEVRLELEPRG